MTGANSQVGKSKAVLMKSGISDANHVGNFSERKSKVKVLTSSSSARSSNLFSVLRSTSANPRYHFYDARILFKGSNSSWKSTGKAIMKAELLSTGMTDMPWEGNTAESSYHSPGNDNSKEKSEMRKRIGKSDDAYSLKKLYGSDPAFTTATSAPTVTKHRIFTRQNRNLEESYYNSYKTLSVKDRRSLGKRKNSETVGNLNFALTVKLEKDKTGKVSVCCTPSRHLRVGKDQQSHNTSMTVETEDAARTNRSNKTSMSPSTREIIKVRSIFKDNGSKRRTKRTTIKKSLPDWSNATESPPVYLMSALHESNGGDLEKPKNNGQTGNILLARKSTASQVSPKTRRTSSTVWKSQSGDGSVSDGRRTVIEMEVLQESNEEMENSFEDNKSNVETASVNDRSRRSANLKWKWFTEQEHQDPFQFTKNKVAPSWRFTLSNYLYENSNRVTSGVTSNQKNQLAKVDIRSFIELDKDLDGKSKSILSIEKDSGDELLPQQVGLVEETSFDGGPFNCLRQPWNCVNKQTKSKSLPATSIRMETNETKSGCTGHVVETFQKKKKLLNVATTGGNERIFKKFFQPQSIKTGQMKELMQPSKWESTVITESFPRFGKKQIKRNFVEMRSALNEEGGWSTVQLAPFSSYFDRKVLGIGSLADAFDSDLLIRKKIKHVNGKMKKQNEMMKVASRRFRENLEFNPAAATHDFVKPVENRRFGSAFSVDIKSGRATSKNQRVEKVPKINITDNFSSSKGNAKKLEYNGAQSKVCKFSSLSPPIQCYLELLHFNTFPLNPPPVKRSTTESTEYLARSSLRKWNFTDEMKTVQGDELLNENKKFSARSHSTIGMNLNRTPHDPRVNKVLTVPPTGIPISKRGNSPDKLKGSSNTRNGILEDSNETRVQRIKRTIPNDDDGRNGSNREEKGILLRKMNTRTKRCTSTLGHTPDQCGGNEDALLDGPNLSRKMIPLRGNVVSNLQMTGSSSDAMMNTKNTDNWHGGLKEVGDLAVGREVPFPGSSNVLQHTASNKRRPLDKFGDRNIFLGNTTGKNADDNEKVSVGEQWRDSFANGWTTSSDKSLVYSQSDKRKMKLSSKSKEYYDYDGTRRDEDIPRETAKSTVLSKSFDYKTGSHEKDSFEERRHLVNKLSPSVPPNYFKKKWLSRTKGHETLLRPKTLSSMSIDVSVPTVFPNTQHAIGINNGEKPLMNSIILASTTMTGAKLTSASGKNGENDVPEEYEEMSTIRVPMGQSSSSGKNDFDKLPTDKQQTIPIHLPHSFYSSGEKAFQDGTEHKKHLMAKAHIESSTLKATSLIHGNSASPGFTDRQDSPFVASIDESLTDQQDPLTSTDMPRQNVVSITSLDPPTATSTSSTFPATSRTTTTTVSQEPPDKSSLATPPPNAEGHTEMTPSILPITPTGMLPIEITTIISASVSFEKKSPTGTTEQIGTPTELPQGTSLPVTLSSAVPTQEVISSPTPKLFTTVPETTPMTVTSAMTPDEHNKPTDAAHTSTHLSTTSSPFISTQSSPEADKSEPDLMVKSTTELSPPECDANVGLEYSKEAEKCVCRTGLQFSQDEKRCIILVGSECFHDGSSYASHSECPLNSFCKPQEMSDSGKGICACAPGFVPGNDQSRCLAGWNTECSLPTDGSDISIKNICHPDFDCMPMQQETDSSKCACRDNRTIGISHSVEKVNINGTFGEDISQMKCLLDYGSDCDPGFDICNTFRFLKCSRQTVKCECEDSDNQLYDEKTKECVARAGTPCTSVNESKDNGTGMKMTGEMRILACVGNSTCSRIGNETNSVFTGTCKCFDGYTQHWQGYCTSGGAKWTHVYERSGLILGLTVIMVIFLPYSKSL